MPRCTFLGGTLCSTPALMGRRKKVNSCPFWGTVCFPTSCLTRFAGWHIAGWSLSFAYFLPTCLQGSVLGTEPQLSPLRSESSGKQPQSGHMRGETLCTPLCDCVIASQNLALGNFKGIRLQLYMFCFLLFLLKILSEEFA